MYRGYGSIISNLDKYTLPHAYYLQGSTFQLLLLMKCIY